MAFGMSMKHSIVFLDRGTLGAELRAPGFPHSYQEYAATPAQLVAERLETRRCEELSGKDRCPLRSGLDFTQFLAAGRVLAE